MFSCANGTTKKVQHVKGLLYMHVHEIRLRVVVSVWSSASRVKTRQWPTGNHMSDERFFAPFLSQHVLRVVSVRQGCTLTSQDQMTCGSGR